MTTLCYSKEGKAISDFFLNEELEIIWDSLVFSPKEILYYSTENIFTRIRLEIVENNLNCEDIIFRYNEIDIPINHFGAILNWPNGFCDCNVDMAEKILRTAMNKHKLERKQ